MTALLKQLIQIGMPENNGFGGSLTDEQMAQWLFTFAQERKADKARYDFFRANVAAVLAELLAQAEAGQAKWFDYHNEANIYEDFAESISATLAKLGLATEGQ